MPEALLSALAAAAGATLAGDDRPVTGIAVHSRDVRPGDLFVALAGTRDNGRRHVPDALARGAVAVLADAAVPGVPTLLVPDARRALAVVAAELQGYPARELRLVGITGTLGKTSTSLLLESALAAAGTSVGAIGSLGVRRGPPRSAAAVHTARMTTPDAPAIHAALRRLADERVHTVVMEITSHGILQERVAGLELAAGLFTNLVPDEHLEYHPTAEHYVRTKLRFLDLLGPDAPLVVDASNHRVLAHVGAHRSARPLVAVALDGAPGTAVRLAGVRHHLNGASFVLEIARDLPGARGVRVPAGEVPLELLLLGRHQLANAAMAAVGALLLGAPADAVARALAAPPPLRRRMEVVWSGRPLVLDDTVGNPRSLRAVFDSVRPIAGTGVRVVFGIRGSRGAAINRRLAATLAESVAGVVSSIPVRLVVTACEDAAGPPNRVHDDERDVVLAALRAAGTAHSYEPTLAGAIDRVFDGCRTSELVLLLGAQGMDRAAELARSRLEAR